ncbi:hypothetical protein HOC76_04175 [bacterium]|nr:hypothetical protein [bacterium]
MKKKSRKKKMTNTASRKPLGYKIVSIAILVSLFLSVCIAVGGVIYCTKPWDWPIWHTIGIK